MKASYTNPRLKHAEMIAFMFAFSQIILALGLFFVLRTHLV